MFTRSSMAPLRRTPAQFLRKHRRAVVAAMVFIAVLATLRALAPDAGATHDALAPVRDLPAGHVLGAADLTTVQVSGDGDTVSQDDLVGRSIAVPWPGGAPLHERALSGSDPARHLPAGQVAVGLQPGRGSPVGFIRAGDQVDVIVTEGENARDQRTITVARATRVLSVTGADADEQAWGSGSEPDEPVIVVAVPRADAAALSAAPRRGPISLVVSG